MAVAHSILVLVYHMLRDNKAYQDLGADFHDRRTEKAVVLRLTRRLQSLGYDVTLNQKEAA